MPLQRQPLATLQPAVVQSLLIIGIVTIRPNLMSNCFCGDVERAEGAALQDCCAPPSDQPPEYAIVGEGHGVARLWVHRRLHYVNIDNLQNKAPFGDLKVRNPKVRNPKNQDLGRLDGFVVDAKGRPYYLVINSGGW